MKKYYSIEPEVAGSITESDFINITARPPEITKLKYRFDGWLEDDILESIMTYIVTERLGNIIKSKNFTGVQLDEVEISVSDQFKHFYPGKVLPHFYWLKVTGIASSSDFGLADKKLIISQQVLDTLKELNLNHAEVEEFG